MNGFTRALWATGVTLLMAGSAHGDLMPDGFKSVKLSIAVEAELPKERALVLANTFRGGSVLETGRVQQVDWHPMAGEMYLVSLSAADARELVKLAGPGADRDKMKQLLDRGKRCSEPFPGVRSLPDSNPADEVRWRFRVAFKGEACQTEEFVTQYLSKDGKVVGTGAPAKATPPAAAPPAAATATAPAPAPAQPSPSAPKATPSAKSGCGSCAVGSSAPRSHEFAALTLVFALGLARRRRRD